MSRKPLGILAVSVFVIFLLFVPIVPLAHSWPANAPPPSAPIAFYGSLSWAMAKKGIEIDGNGEAHFRY